MRNQAWINAENVFNNYLLRLIYRRQQCSQQRAKNFMQSVTLCDVCPHSKIVHCCLFLKEIYRINFDSLTLSQSVSVTPKYLRRMSQFLEQGSSKRPLSGVEGDAGCTCFISIRCEIDILFAALAAFI